MCDKQKTQERVQTPIQVSEEQQRRVEDSRYVIRRMDESQYYSEAKKISDNVHENYIRRNVRDAIIKNLGRERYAAFDGLMIQGEGVDDEESIALHHAAGSKLALEGEDVIEFNVAGSGYMNYRLPQKGISGYGSADDFKEEKKARWYNKNKLLTWTKLAKTESSIEEYNDANIEQNKKIEEIYGKKLEYSLKGRKMNHIRKKESVNVKGAGKTRFYLRGPNTSNTGKYSEDNLEEYILELGKQTLKNKLETWDWLSDEELRSVKPVNIIIQGHSRGAVAAGLGAMRLKKWISDTYPSLLHMVKFQLIQNDPVPGDYENFGNNAKIDHLGAKDKKSRYMPLGEDAETTVVYSIHTQYPLLFTPQYVKNAKRIILTASDHGVNLDKRDESQDKVTRATYLAEKNGQVEAFRSTGLNELDEGVYIADDRNNLIKIRSLEEYDSVARTLLSGVKSQKSRHEILRKAVAAWFSGYEERKLKEKEDKKTSTKPVTDKEAANREKLRNELTSLTTPVQLKKVQEEKEKLDKMPQDSPKQAEEYLKKKEKYLKAKKSGLINYINWLYDQKGSFINKTRRDYLNKLIALSYQLEKFYGGFASEKRQEKIASLAKEVRQYAGIDNLDSFLPAYLKRELYLGSEKKLRAFLVMPALKEEAEEKKAEEKNAVPEKKEEEKSAEEKKAAPEDAEEKKIEEEKAAGEKAEEVKPAEEKEIEAEKQAEVKAEEKAEEKAEKKKEELQELPFAKYDVQISGLDKAFETQDINNCYCCVGAAMLNQFISKKKGYKSVIKHCTQYDLRSFRPEVRKFDPANKAGLGEEVYHGVVREIDQFAGAGKHSFGNLFDMGDFMFDRLSKEGIENVMLNRILLNVSKIDEKKKDDPVEQQKVETRVKNYRSMFADKINEILSGGSVAGVYITEGKNPHYVTITGIRGDELTIYDPYEYKGKPYTVKIDELVKPGRSLDVSWLSDMKPAEDLKKEYPNLELGDDGESLKLKDENYSDYYLSISHTKGITVSNEQDNKVEGLNDFGQMAYIPVKNTEVEKITLSEAVTDAVAWEEEKKLQQIEAERKEAEKKRAEQFDRSVKLLFNDIFKGRGLLLDTFKDLNTEFKSEKKESVSYNRLRSALERVRMISERVGDPESVFRSGELMDAMTALSETANSYYDLHRGHQYTDRGEKRRKACDTIRELVSEFYDRLDMNTGGKGLGNVTENKLPEGVTEKEIKKSGEKLQELYKNYENWKEHFAAREGCDRANIRDKAALFSSYERYIEIYKASHSIKKRPKEIDEIIRVAAFYKVQNSAIERFEDMRTGFDDTLLKLAIMHVDAMDNRQKPEKTLEKRDTDKDLSTDQIKAIDAIDQWFLRNSQNAGLMGWAVGAKNHNSEAVSALLGKTRRERLFIYYLIESGKRKNPEMFDVYSSQTEYIPDLNKFKKQMLATGFKVLSHLSGEYVAMNKLSDAIQANREYKDLIMECTEPVAVDKSVKLEDLKKDKIAYRTYMLGEVFQSAKAYRDKAAQYLKKKKKKDAKAEAELNALKEKAASDLKELIAADTAVGEAESYGGITEQGTKKSAALYSVKSNNAGDLSNNTKYLTQYGTKAAQNAGTVVEGVVDGVDLVEKGIEKVIPSADLKGWKLKDSTLATTDFFGGTVTASGISAVGSLLTAIVGIYNLSKSSSGMHAGDIGANVVRIINSAASATTTVWKGVEATQQYVSATDTVLNGAVSVSPALKIAGTVTAGVGTGLESYNTITGLLDCRNASKASKYLKKKAEANKDSGKDKYEKNMLKVSKDISSRKAKTGGFNFVASGMSLAGLFIPVFGAAISLTGAGLTLASGVVNIFGIDLKKIRKTMFDSYFCFEEYLKKAVLVMESKGEKVYDMKVFRRRMRRTLSAAAGFSSVESACDHIGKRYADYICTKLFGDEGERTTDENERKAYIQLIKSFGLPYSEEKKIPAAASLARKMNGR